MAYRFRGLVGAVQPAGDCRPAGGESGAGSTGCGEEDGLAVGSAGGGQPEWRGRVSGNRCLEERTRGADEGNRGGSVARKVAASRYGRTGYEQPEFLARLLRDRSR